MFHAHTFYSFNYGVQSPEELLQTAQSLGITTLALTDINNTSGCIDFIRLAPKYNVKPLVGVDFRHGATPLYIVIAKNNNGFRQINEFLTHYKMQHLEVPETPPLFHDCIVIFPWKKNVRRTLRENEFTALRTFETAPFRLYEKKIAAEKIIALQTLSFRHKRDYNTHRLLRAIANNTLLSKLHQTEDTSWEWKDTELRRQCQLFEEFPQAVKNAQRIQNECSIFFEFGKSKNKKCFTQSETDDRNLLQQLAYEGLQYRYPNANEKTKQRLEMELETIMRLGFTAYFLINWDMVRFARTKGFFYVGRGSGANSLVAYCMRITDVDPIELDLYFERFINASRRNPPDFDIDFSHTDRDTVRAYLCEKYKGHAALVGSYNTFERKSCIREIAKVFGLPDDEIEQLQAERLDWSRLDEYGKLVLRYADAIKGLPNLLSVHACGVLISEAPITCYSALELMPVGFPSVQFSMLEAEDVGLYKFDVLSQRGLGHIKDAVQWIRENRGETIDIHRIHEFKQDARIKQMLRQGDTIGCFYVESPAMRQLLRKLEVEDYLGLVAASSVIRPGVSSSGMMRQYILRYRYPEKRKEAHPVLNEIMPETFGVMVYQEDVIKVANQYAGLTLEQADVMRRGMSGKFRSRAEFQEIKQAFFDNCKLKNYDEADVTEVWRQIESFAGYSFAKGHSASYAVESYQSMFLRAYYPIEFMTAVLNNFGGFYSTEFYLHEARMLGAQIELPCINNSGNLAVLKGTTIYMGWCLVKDLEQRSISNLLEERKRNGAFKSLADFVKRVAISLDQLRILIKLDAFRFTGRTSKELLWEAHLLLNKNKKTTPRRELFETTAEPTTLPPLEYGEYEQPHDQMQLLGFPYTTPFALLEKQYRDTATAKTLLQFLGKEVYITGYYVTIKPVTTIHGDRMYFGSFTDRQGYLFDTVHFPASIEQYPFTGKGCYLLKGKVIEEFGVASIDVSHMVRIPWKFLN